MREFVGEIEITSNTFRLGAIEAENGFCVEEIGLASHCSGTSNSPGIEVFDVYRQLFEGRKLLLHRKGAIDELVSAQPVFGAGICSSSMVCQDAFLRGFHNLGIG